MDLLDPSIAGHEQTQRDLRRAFLSGRLGHAHLFLGPEGVGKRRVALALGRALTCAASADNAPCGACHSCLMATRGTHPDLRLFAPDKSVYGVEMVRDEVLDWAARKPREGKRKVGVLDAADHLGAASANAFLKTLEEPPPGTYWILVASDAGGVLPTIVSRCRVVFFRPLNDENLERAARSDAPDDIPPALWELARTCAQGSPGRFLSLLADDLLAQRDMLIALLTGRGRVSAIDTTEALLAWVARSEDETRQDMRERASRVLSLAELCLRDVLVLARTGGQARLFNTDLAARLSIGALGDMAAMAALERVGDLRAALERNAAPRLVLTSLAFEMETLGRASASSA